MRHNALPVKPCAVETKDKQKSLISIGFTGLLWAACNFFIDQQVVFVNNCQNVYFVPQICDFYFCSVVGLLLKNNFPEQVS
jgi:hypothetical protein